MKQITDGKPSKYRSVYYHTYEAYTDIADGVLVSHKIYWSFM